MTSTSDSSFSFLQYFPKVQQKHNLKEIECTQNKHVWYATDIFCQWHGCHLLLAIYPQYLSEIFTWLGILIFLLDLTYQFNATECVLSHLGTVGSFVCFRQAIVQVFCLIKNHKSKIFLKFRDFYTNINIYFLHCMSKYIVECKRSYGNTV